VPNQFWLHKNHLLIVQALDILKAQDRAPVVIATGLMQDRRHPGHVEALQDNVRKCGLDALFRPLGVVPYRDMLGLMADAVAVCNPSRFEGWSTSVEEAKSLGKLVLLSDIPVHREQSPGRARYFDQDSPEQLAAAIWDAWTAFDPTFDLQARQDAAGALAERMQAFARAYEAIVLDAVQAGRA
jgi:glycosyltransferase involved in cell wall biosynthesis